MGAVSALSVAQNHALGAGASGTEPGAEWLARAPAAAAAQQVDGVATPGVDRTRPALLAGSPALEAPGRGTVRGVKMMIGYDRVNRQMRRGELVTVQNGAGQPAFWLRGGGTSYRLMAADGKPITDLGPAEARAHQLIGNGAAARLREVRLSSSGGAEFTAPGDRTSPRLSIDLESPDINVKGGRGQAHVGLFRLGGRGSALTSGDAVARAQAMGINVRVTNENPKGPPDIAQLHAWVELTNDRAGGRQFHNFTRNLNPGTFDPSATSYKVPANASRAFIEGYDQASREFGMALGAQLVRSIAEGKTATSAARSNVSIPVRQTRTVPAGQPVRSSQPPSPQTPHTPVVPGAVRPSTARPGPGVTPSKPGKVSGVNPTVVNASASVSAKQGLQRQLRALGIQCDDPTTIRTGPGSHAVVGTTKGGATFEIAIRSNGSLAPRSAALAGGHTIATDPPGEAAHGSGRHAAQPATKKPLQLTGPKSPYQSVVSIPPPPPESIPRIPQPTKVIGAGEVNVIYEHPTNPRLVVALTNAKFLAKFAKYGENGNTGPLELASVNDDVNTLRWLGNAGLPVIKPVGLVRIGDRYGVVKPKIDGGVFSKDPAPASTDTWRQLVKSHGREIIQQLRQIDRTMTKLGVVDFDFQFYIDARGQVALYDPGFVTSERDPSRHQHRITELWVDRIKTDMLHIRYGEPVIGPVTGDEQKNMPKL